MVLHLIGIGLGDEKDITLRGLEIVKRSSKVFLESYTSRLNCPIERLEALYDKKIILADRDLVEKDSDSILGPAKDDDVAFLVIGDPFGATTHTDLVLRAREAGVEVKVVNNASILNAIGIVGLELYKFGKTTSIVFPQPGWKVETHYDVIRDNSRMGLHTLCLLDIKTKEPSKESIQKGSDQPEPARFMTVNEAIESLLKIESGRQEGVVTSQTLVVGCARIGSEDFMIRAGPADDIRSMDFGEPLHCLIVPGNLHFIEEQAVSHWNQR